MSEARDNIFLKINAHDNGQVSDDDILLEAEELLSDVHLARSKQAGSDVVDYFVRKLQGPKVGATTNRVNSISDIPNAISQFFQKTNLEKKVVLQPTDLIQSLDWASQNIAVHDDIDGSTVVCAGAGGIAETGSVIFHSSHEMPILYNFLPMVQIIIVFSDMVVPYLEDYRQIAEALDGGTPRNLCMVTGPSGTSDIEGDFVKGAHGPSDVHVIIVDTQ